MKDGLAALTRTVVGIRDSHSSLRLCAPCQNKPNLLHFTPSEYKIHSLSQQFELLLVKSLKERIRYYTIQLYCIYSQQSPLTKGLLPSWVVGKKGRGGKNSPRSLLSLMEPESRGSPRCSVWFVLWHLVCSRWAGAVCLAALGPFYLPTERKKDGKTLGDPALDRRPRPPLRDCWRKSALTWRHQAPQPHAWCPWHLWYEVWWWGRGALASKMHIHKPEIAAATRRPASACFTEMTCLWYLSEFK